MYDGDVIYKTLQPELHFTIVSTAKHVDVSYETDSHSFEYFHLENLLWTVANFCDRKNFIFGTDLDKNLRGETRLMILWPDFDFDRFHRRSNAIELNLYLIKPHFNVNGVNIMFDRKSGQNANKSFGLERPRNYCLNELLTKPIATNA